MLLGGFFGLQAQKNEMISADDFGSLKPPQASGYWLKHSNIHHSNVRWLMPDTLGFFFTTRFVWFWLQNQKNEMISADDFRQLWSQIYANSVVENKPEVSKKKSSGVEVLDSKVVEPISRFLWNLFWAEVFLIWMISADDFGSLKHPQASGYCLKHSNIHHYNVR